MAPNSAEVPALRRSIEIHDSPGALIGILREVLAGLDVVRLWAAPRQHPTGGKVRLFGISKCGKMNLSVAGGPKGYMSRCMTSSSTDFGGRTRDSGSVPSGSSTRLSSSVNVGFCVST